MNTCTSVDSEELFQQFDLARVSLFGAMSASQLKSLWDYLQVRHYSAGQQIFRQFELPSEIYIVLTGKIDFVIEKNGVPQIEACFGSGQTFGESAFLGIQPHPGCAQVRSGDSADILVITRDALIDLQKQNKDLFALLMMNLAREVSRKYQACLLAT